MWNEKVNAEAMDEVEQLRAENQLLRKANENLQQQIESLQQQIVELSDRLNLSSRVVVKSQLICL